MGTMHALTSLLNALLRIMEADHNRASDSLLILCVVTFLSMTLLLGYLGNVLGKEIKPKLPPSPPQWPVLGNLPHIMRKSAALHTTLRLLGKKLGPIYTLWLGRSFPLVIVTGEETAREAFVDQGHIFSARPTLISWQYISSGYRTTMTTPAGAHWQKLRKIISHHLISPTNLARYIPVRDSEIQKLLERFRDQSRENEGVVHPLQQLRISAVDIIMRIAFGDEFATLDNEGRKGNAVVLDRLFQEIMDAGSIFQIALDSSPLTRTLLFSASRKCYSNIRTIAGQITDLVMPIVMERKRLLKERPLTEVKTFVDSLIMLKGDDALTDMEIVWNVVELMVGATDNTSHILEWIFANMITYPHVQQKAYEEVKRAMGPNLDRGLVQENHIPNLPYIQAIVKESMRRHMMAVLAIPRIASRDCKLRGYDIPKGTMVVLHAGALALNEEIWSDPLEFRPERFLNLDNEATHMHKMAFLPFGVGRRSCPGASMGLLHLHMLLANLIYRFEWGPESPGQPVDFSEKFRMVVTMKSRLRATITERSPV
ncbi:cytochrome P450 77A1 [Physcomitrium patens]|nr:cytochrome P450 77A1-like [Physcomitrium patens]|eukprot:XP_024385389.1 cytochrome P450 77A1-like [Physcomitrella patens]